MPWAQQLEQEPAKSLATAGPVPTAPQLGAWLQRKQSRPGQEAGERARLGSGSPLSALLPQSIAAVVAAARLPSALALGLPAPRPGRAEARSWPVPQLPMPGQLSAMAGMRG